MSFPTPSQSVSHKQFHQCLNYKKKLSLWHPLPTFCRFSFFQASLWLGVDKVLQKLPKSYKSEVRHLFHCYILIPRKCPRKTLFQHTVGHEGDSSDFGISINPKTLSQSGGGGRLSPPDYYSTPLPPSRISGPSYGPTEVYFLEHYLSSDLLRMKNDQDILCWKGHLKNRYW